MQANATKFQPKDMQGLIDAVGRLMAQVETLQRQASKPQPQVLPGFDAAWPTPTPTPTRQRAAVVSRWKDPLGLGREQYAVLEPFVPVGEAQAVTAAAIGRMSGMGGRVPKGLHNAIMRGEKDLKRKPTASGPATHINPWLYWREP